MNCWPSIILEIDTTLYQCMECPYFFLRLNASLFTDHWLFRYNSSLLNIGHFLEELRNKMYVSMDYRNTPDFVWRIICLSYLIFYNGRFLKQICKLVGSWVPPSRPVKERVGKVNNSELATPCCRSGWMTEKKSNKLSRKQKLTERLRTCSNKMIRYDKNFY